MSDKNYRMSFSTGGLFQRESLQLADLYMSLHDWQAVSYKVIQDNLLQARTAASLKRVLREVVFRLQTLSEDELSALLAGDHQEQGFLLWLAVCRSYPFIAEFSTTVLRERYLSRLVNLEPEDFEAFFHRQSEWHPELEKIRPSTRGKLRQVLFRMLREAGLLTADNQINPAILSPAFVARLTAADRKQELTYYPIFDADLKRLMS
ncbi:MAG: DUF1819 family protein [Deltaproteobacteria bacterium]|nr:DUF1819 family protein [Deltaproteobacteria bacterium]